MLLLLRRTSTSESVLSFLIKLKKKKIARFFFTSKTSVFAIDTINKKCSGLKDIITIIADKLLLFRIYKEVLQINNKQGKDANR